MERHSLYMFRHDKKLTMSEMAKKFCCSRVTYSLIEKGKRDGTQQNWDNFQREFNIPDEEMYKYMKKEERKFIIEK